MKKQLLIGVLVSVALSSWAYSAKKVRPPKAAPSKAEEKIRSLVTTPETRIGFVLYTLHEGTLKMTVQFYPLDKGESRTTILEARRGGQWVKVADAVISEEPYSDKQGGALSWTALFRVENWNDTVATRYRVVAIDGKSTYEGMIRKNPVEEEEIAVAVFTGNSWKGDGYVMRPDIIANINAQDPDLLFFSGDQVYIKSKHLADWLVFGKQFGEITRNRPTICIPDDHDVGNGNIWGEGGKEGLVQGFGSPQFVKMVQRAQTSNLPDPYDPTPIERGIGVYYTSLKVGRVDFAILEDRKFKTNPQTLRQRLTDEGIAFKHSGKQSISDVEGGLKNIDRPDFALLGARQLSFLDAWGQDWAGVDMKVALSQTLFVMGHTGADQDFDTNGWPMSGRNRAVETLRKSFAISLNGDQHLATVSQLGVDAWRDSIWSFSCPSIQNHCVRKWLPTTGVAGQPLDGPLEHMGDYFDGFGNRLTMHAYANADKNVGKAEGYSLVRFNVNTRKIVMECWPRNVDVTQPDAKQYVGWPITIDQQDNYARKAVAWLPTLKVSGMVDPVVQVINETTKEILYTLRINGSTFTPKVFSKGTFTVRVGELETAREKTLKNVSALDKAGAKSIAVQL